MPMASKTRAILLAVVLLSAGLAGCADTDDTDTGDTEDTGEPDTGERDTGERDTGERDTDDTNDTGDDTDAETEDHNETFEDTIDEQDYEREWTFPVDETGADITIEAHLQGDAVDDFEATMWDAEQEEICTVTDGMDGLTDDGENTCEHESENTGEYMLKVWGNSTAESADYMINVTVEYGGNETTTGDDDTTTGGEDRQGDESNGGIYGQSTMARMLGT